MIRIESEPEHADAFAEALAAAEALLPPDASLGLDGLWGEPPHIAVVTSLGRVIAGRGDTPAAALRDLARSLRDIEGRMTADPP